MSSVVDLANKFSDELEALDEEALLRIVKAYQRIYGTLESRVDALLLEIAKLENATVSQVRKMARLKALEAQIIEEVTRFQGYLRTELIAAAETSFDAASAQSQQLIKALLAEVGIQAQLGGLPADAFQALVAFLQEGSALYKRIDLLAGTLADYVRETLLEAVALGYNPVKTSRLIKEAFGRGLTDALRMARTAQLYAQRVATQANYQNSEVLDGWVWYAHLDDTVCPVCAAQHGTIHDLDETLNGHHNCRCVMLPYIKEFGNPVEENGVDWFDNLSERQKIKLIGKGKYELYKQGKITLPSLIGHREDDVYGRMIREKALKELP